MVMVKELIFTVKELIKISYPQNMVLKNNPLKTYTKLLFLKSMFLPRDSSGGGGVMGWGWEDDGWVTEGGRGGGWVGWVRGCRKGWNEVDGWVGGRKDDSVVGLYGWFKGVGEGGRDGVDGWGDVKSKRVGWEHGGVGGVDGPCLRTEPVTPRCKGGAALSF